MRTKLLLPAIFAAFSVAAPADLIIESKLESPQINSNITTKLKDGRMRADMSGPLGAMSSIMEPTGDAVQLIHGQKMAMKTSAEQIKQAIETGKKLAGGTADADAPKTEPKATGEKEKVGEYDCEIYTWSGGGTTSRFWIALKHPKAAQLKAAEEQMRKGTTTFAGAGPDVSKLPGPALKTENTIGGMKTVVTILSIKEEPVAASDFEVPKDYQTMDMSKLGGGAAPAPAPAKK